MSELNLDNLRMENWSGLPPMMKMTALQNFENNLARFQGREKPCLVMEKSILEAANDPEKTFDLSRNRICINPLSLQDAKPYQAVSELYNGSTKAFYYQNHDINNPLSKQNSQKLEDIRQNEDIYFHRSENSNSNIRNCLNSQNRYQPIEAEARKATQKQMDQLYRDYFHDNIGYEEFRENQQKADRQQRIDDRVFFKTDDYEKEVAQSVREGYALKYPAEAQSNSQAAGADGGKGAEQKIDAGEGKAARQIEEAGKNLAKDGMTKIEGKSGDLTGSAGKEDASKQEDQYYGYGL